MICSKSDLEEYLQSDKKALGRKEKYPRLTDYIWKYEILLRKCEYINNCVKNPLLRILGGGVIRYKRAVLGARCGFSIPINCVGKGLCIAHIGPIIINPYALIGENCRIHVGVNIGADARISNAAPTIGNNVYIGPGAKLFGQIEIADGIAIGANAVVNKSFLEKDISIAGVPAQKIGIGGTKGIIY